MTNVSSCLPSAELLNTISPDEVIAMGASLQGSIIYSSNDDPQDTGLQAEILAIPQPLVIKVNTHHQILFQILQKFQWYHS